MDLSLKNLEQAVSLRRQIDSLEKRFASLIGGGTSRSASRGSSRPAGQRRVSAATRAKLAAAARARWAKQKGGKVTARAGGLEPPRVAPYGPEPYASANSATRANSNGP